MRKALMVPALLVTWILLTVGFVNVLADASRSDDIPDRPYVTGEVPTSRPSTTARPDSGVTDDHVEQHATMTQRMRVADPNSRKQALMNNDPMWQMMRDPAHIRAEEEYQRQIDRMLARNQ